MGDPLKRLADRGDRRVVTRRIRVLELLVSAIPGGGPRHVYDLVRHLPKDEFEVDRKSVV